MTEKELATNNMSAKSSEVPTNQQQQKVDKKLITLTGITTSQIRTRAKLSDTPAYCFLKTDQQEQDQRLGNFDKLPDIPIIFRIREQKPCPHHKKYFSDLQKEINCCP
ncbi:2446_t:CDS:1 [Cetraspora pellucida]|uniref:2446_t:CDS:1 n=1 Tax=Cetraspora pellucida TaxID=1433469 RepID=A0ACA9NPA9_9GLOM|nr:2446_t:CDS:1 [Cetraspora pellucida]